MSINNCNLKMENLWNTYSEYVLNECRQKTENLLLAKDIRQDVFMKIMRELRNFKGDSSIEEWLHKIINDCCADRLK